MPSTSRCEEQPSDPDESWETDSDPEPPVSSLRKMMRYANEGLLSESSHDEHCEDSERYRLVDLSKSTVVSNAQVCDEGETFPGKENQD